jgi:hypothetical protein
MNDGFSFRSALAGGLVAALVMMAVPAVAGVGDAIILGVRNLGSAETEVQGSQQGPLVRIDNNHEDGNAARFEVKPGNAPFTVNSGKKVKGLNADKIDGYSSAQLIRMAFGASSNAPDANGNAVTADIHAPRAGWLVMSGSIDANGTTEDLYTCRLQVDGVTAPGTIRGSKVDDGGGEHTDNDAENCSTTGAMQVAAGSHTVALLMADRNSAAFLEASVWALYVPFDGDGTKP